MDYTKGCIEECLQNEPPFCTAVCPFGLDVRDFIAKLQRGGFQAAYKAYLNAVGFPGIVAALCPEPCKDVCPRSLCGGAIAMRLLERAAIDNARSLEPTSYNIRSKGKKVAVIGAGISGLACTLRLASKGYEITLFEKSGRIGGHLHHLLPAEAFLPEIQRQFMHETYDLRLDTEIQSLEELAFDAIYVATGAGGTTFGLSAEPGGAFASTRPGVFLGGSLMGSDTMGAIADGLQAGHALERFIKVGSMNQPVEARGTRLQLNPERFTPVAAVVPADGKAFTQEEAVAEARRCLLCACDACTRACDLMHYFRKFPKRIAEEIHLSVYPGTLDGNGTLATRLMSTCNQCGLCKEVCPQGIDTGSIFLQGHQAMHARGAMPWAWHDFFLRDMASANTETGLSRLPPGQIKSRFLFFPGCQLGASDPRYVTESYRFLRSHWPDTAITLGCCGAPAEWAGDEALRDEVTTKIRESWIAFGKPVAVFACPTCKQVFGRHLPEIEGVFLYDLMLEQGHTPPQSAGSDPASVFDPCASREEPKLQQAVRALAEHSGFHLEPLPGSGRLAQCCSWGGQVSVAHPPYARQVVKDRIAEGSHPYITYCSNCRDIFAAAGKRAWHVLDILFGLNGADRVPPTITGRRNNRMTLKRTLLQEYWNETIKREEAGMELKMAPELRRKLHDELLLETDLATVIATCEASGNKVLDPATGTCSGHLLIGQMTYWVEYRPAPGAGFELIRAYAHRMRIEGE